MKETHACSKYFMHISRKLYNHETRNRIIEISTPDGTGEYQGNDLGHMVAAQEGICYKRSGLQTNITEDYFNTYKPGTKPERFIDAEEFELIKHQLFSTLEQLDTDQDAGVFENYGAFVTRYGVELRNIEDAIAFLPFHDGFHIGYVMSIMKLVNQD